MSNKAKGSNVERELLKLFTENSWRAIRVAGSGVNDLSPCDMIAVKTGRKGYIVEVKSSRKDRIYISKEQIEDFMLFTTLTGLTPVIALRFNYEGWLFIPPTMLEDSGKNWVISLEKAKEEGQRFSQFFESQ